ncbi:hypothetical protein HDU79_006203 [Rhizoclosmatium sp. JEL0117]|nr:hypothetical protein HDU79_006203 [Rhizoclosmatium sp. JEL0117]
MSNAPPPPTQTTRKRRLEALGGDVEVAATAKRVAAPRTAATSTTTATTTTKGHPTLREISHFRFYFAGLSVRNKKECEAAVSKLNSKTALLFRKECLSHVIVHDDDLAVANRKLALQPKSGNPLADLTGPTKIIAQARLWNIPIWPLSEFTTTFKRLFKDSAAQHQAAGINSKPAANGVSRQRSLQALVTKERLNAQRTNRGLDPSGSLRGFKELKGCFVLVEDAAQLHKPIGYREYNVDLAVNPDFQNTATSCAYGSWPIMYLEKKPNGSFLGNAFLPPDSEAEGDEDAESEEGDDENVEKQDVDNDVDDNNDGTTKTATKSKKKKTKKSIKSAARTEDQSDSGTDDNHSTTTNPDYDDMAEQEGEDEEDENMPGSGYIQQQQQMLGMNSAASGLNNTTSQRPVQEPTNPSKPVETLLKRVCSRNAVAAAATAAAVEAEAVPAEQQQHQQQADAQPPTRTKRRRQGPKGKDFYFRAGYCENCAEKYDHFIDHVNSTRHQAWATDHNNFGTIDTFIESVARKVKRVIPAWTVDESSDGEDEEEEEIDVVGCESEGDDGVFENEEEEVVEDSRDGGGVVVDEDNEKDDAQDDRGCTNDGKPEDQERDSIDHDTGNESPTHQQAEELSSFVMKTPAPKPSNQHRPSRLSLPLLPPAAPIFFNSGPTITSTQSESTQNTNQKSATTFSSSSSLVASTTSRNRQQQSVNKTPIQVHVPPSRKTPFLSSQLPLLSSQPPAVDTAPKPVPASATAAGPMIFVVPNHVGEKILRKQIYAESSGVRSSARRSNRVIVQETVIEGNVVVERLEGLTNTTVIYGDGFGKNDGEVCENAVEDVDVTPRRRRM